jgi:hypothetical protein
MIQEGGAQVSDKQRADVATIADDDDVDDDEPEPQEIRAGGASRTAESGDIYWLNLDQLREFNRMDRTIESDEDFWAWFDAAVKTWGKKPTGKMLKRRGMLSGLWSGGGSWEPKKYLSDWWHGSTYFGGGSNEKVRKLAIALQAVQTTVRVVDNHERRMRVVLAADEREGKPQSFTSYDERVIQVSPMALLDSKLETGEGIDITNGFALHEASHAEYSESTLKALRQPTPLEPLTVASILHNVLEDVRIESLTGEQFPGFVGYFERALNYMWELSKDNQPSAWGPELKDKLSAIILACKWYDKFAPTVTDTELKSEVEWWHDWVESYRTSRQELRPALIAGLDRLRSDPATAKEMRKIEAEELALGAFTDADGIRRLVRTMIKKYGLNKFPSCSGGESPGGGLTVLDGVKRPGLGAKESEEVRRLVESEIEEADIEHMKLPDLNGANPTVTVLHPPETGASHAGYKPTNQSLVERMRSVFFFRPSAFENVDRLMRTGSVDEDELWRAGVEDYRLFDQKTIEQTPNTSVTLLIDASGSMLGHVAAGSLGRSKIALAANLAQIMQACLKDMNGVNVRVRAHTGDCPDGEVVIYKIWERGEPLSRLGLMNTIHNSNNYDGYAIGWCIKEMVDHATPNEQMVLIVISDGYPAGQGYQGNPAYRHMRETIAWGARQGVDTIQIAIQGGMDQKLMFQHFVHFESIEKLPMQLTTLLRKIFPYR